MFPYCSRVSASKSGRCRTRHPTLHLSGRAERSRRNYNMQMLWNRASAVLCIAGVLTLIDAGAQPATWKFPVAMRKLANGLTVVVSEDHSSPTFGLCVSFGIGFRLEPEGRTGFAHLFEHMMFEG